MCGTAIAKISTTGIIINRIETIVIKVMVTITQTNTRCDVHKYIEEEVVVEEEVEVRIAVNIITKIANTGMSIQKTSNGNSEGANCCEW